MRAFAKLLLIFLIVVLSRPVWGYVTQRSLGADQQVIQLKWKTGSTINWRLNPTRGVNVTGARDQADVFRAAFNAWQAVPTAALNFAEGANTAVTLKAGVDDINLISTNVNAADYGSSAVGRTITIFYDTTGLDDLNRTIEFPGQIMEADIVFNPTNLFSTDGTPVAGRFDLQSVATHEIGHMLGLDHTSITSAVMFPTVTTGTGYARTLSVDEMAGVSTIYPSAAFASKGSLSGTVRTTANVVVYGAIVTAVNANGQPVASAITNPQGQYTIAGLDAGTYTIYAEPMDQPLQIGNLPTLTTIYPSSVVQTNFLTRFR